MFIDSLSLALPREFLLSNTSLILLDSLSWHLTPPDSILPACYLLSSSTSAKMETQGRWDYIWLVLQSTPVPRIIPSSQQAHNKRVWNEWAEWMNSLRKGSKIYVVLTVQSEGQREEPNADQFCVIYCINSFIQTTSQHLLEAWSIGPFSEMKRMSSREIWSSVRNGTTNMWWHQNWRPGYFYFVSCFCCWLACFSQKPGFISCLPWPLGMITDSSLHLSSR